MTRTNLTIATADDAQPGRGRRHQLRRLLVSAADIARQARHASGVDELAGRASASGRAIRDRVSTLLRAAS